MSDHRRVAVFHRGTPREEVVTFNEDAPTSSQALAAELGIKLLLRVGGTGVGAAWLLSLIGLMSLAVQIGADYGLQGAWMIGALSVACLKPALAMALKTTNDRGIEVAAWFGAALLLAPFLIVSVIATSAFLGGKTFGLFVAEQAATSKIVSGLVGFLFAIAIEFAATFGPVGILTAIKAMREAYERPPVPMPVEAAPARMLPALDSFEAGFSLWAEQLKTEHSGTVRSPAAYEHYKRWASFNGPYFVPSRETFGKALADHARALGARPSISGGYATYHGVALPGPLQLPKLPASV